MQRPFIRPMPGRDITESHRPATPLELFFDLVCVIAIASAAAGLHHAIAENHIGIGILTFTYAFGSIWWAWMNFTWFASAYDNDDIPYRIAVFVMIGGAMLIAAGIPAMMVDQDSTLGLTGYIIMRLALVSLWLRAGKHDPSRRTTAIRYAVGISMCQTLWIVGVLFVPAEFFFWFFPFAFICEWAVPWYAEKAAGTPWHKGHIAERYGLLTIIVLGESLLALSMAISASGEIGSWSFEQHMLILSGLILVFSMWWLYFSESEHLALDRTESGFIWGYGHLVVFGSAAAVGAGLALNVDVLSGHAHVEGFISNAALTIPSALFLFGLWIVHDQFNHKKGFLRYLVPITALLLLGATYVPFAPAATALLLTGCLMVRLKQASFIDDSHPTVS